MSSERSNPRKPTSLAPTRTTRSTLSPRGPTSNVSSTITTAKPVAPKVPTTMRTPVVSPRFKLPSEGPGISHVTPRSSVRMPKAAGMETSSSQDDVLGITRPKTSLGATETPSPRNSTSSVMGSGLGGGLSNNTVTRPKTAVGDEPSRSPPLVRSPGLVDPSQKSTKDSIDSRFFHASEAQKQDSAPKRPDPKRTPTFFYADGKEDKPSIPPEASPPMLPAILKIRSNGPRPETSASSSKSSPVMSLPTASASSPSLFLSSLVASQGPLRSPSPSKENIHLSYRKGASQIFGARPGSIPTFTTMPTSSKLEEPRRPSFGHSRRKSPSVSSIDSGKSHQSRRRSATTVDLVEPAISPRISSPTVDLPSIDTSIATLAQVDAQPQGALSPTKYATELAADARRERKVLDLEISNSSLLAINASLERELRRQKAELKRFRRLSRAGRFSMAGSELSRRISDDLMEDDDDEEDELNPFGSIDHQDEPSDSEDEGSLLSGGERMSPGAHASREQDRLEKDERRLRVDFERHKELLTQSQAMNQSLKRCMYATEDMIREGRKALDYHVEVSDVRLGGRILSGHEDDDTIEIEVEFDDDAFHGDDGMESAKGLLAMWQGVGRTAGSEGSGDRDSGIEVDKAQTQTSIGLSNTSDSTGDSGRPPEDTR